MSFLPESTELDGVFLLRPHFFEDERGRFRRTFCARSLAEVGIHFEVRQSNLSENPHAFTLRGFHWQASEERKLLTCVAGEIHDVVLDIRPGSPTRGRQQAFRLSAENGLALLLPPGCANAWLTLRDHSSIAYWHSDEYRPELDCGIRFDDPAFNIKWPAQPRLISSKDRSHPDYRSTV